MTSILALVPGDPDTIYAIVAEPAADAPTGAPEPERNALYIVLGVIFGAVVIYLLARGG